MAYEQKKNWDAASADWLQAAPGNPQWSRQLVALVQRLRDSGEFALAESVSAKARVVFEEQLVKEPENSLAGELADVLLPMGTRSLLPTSEAEGVAWQFTTTQPPDDWTSEDFEDSAWKEGLGGFGAGSSQGFVKRSTWTTNDIWLRRTFEWQPASTEHSLVLRLIRDDDAEVYLNGQQVANLPGWTPGYIDHSLDAAAIETLHAGTNTIAVHCRQYSGGQHVDAGLDVMPYGPRRLQQRFTAMKITDAWARLAAAYLIINDQRAFDKLIQAVPAVESSIAEFYLTMKDWDRAIAAYSKLIGDATTDASLLVKRGEAYFATKQFDLARADWRRAVELIPGLAQTQYDRLRQAERWSEAAEFGLKLIEPNPEDTLVWLRTAPMLALAEDPTVYSEFCGRMSQHFADSKTPETAERVVKASLLRADSIDLAKLPGDLLARSLDDGTVPEWLPPWAWGSRALLAYRRGEAESAVQYVAKSEEYKPIDVAHALNLAVLAMAQHQLGKAGEAKTALEEASQLITSLKGDPGRKGDHDLLIAEILFREAESRINK